MNKTLMRIIIPVLVVGGVMATVVMADPVAAQGSIQEGVAAARGNGQPSELLNGNGGGIFTMIVNIMLFIVGVLSVIMLIIGGLRYVVSGGNSSAVSAAKNTILYAIVGLVVALLSYAIVTFILRVVMGGDASSLFGDGGGTNV